MAKLKAMEAGMSKNYSIKHKRSDITTMLSKMVSLEEIIIDTVHEMLGLDVGEVTRVMNESRFKKALFNTNADYYQNDPNLLVADFLREGKERFGWNIGL